MNLDKKESASAVAGTLNIGGIEYVVVPRAEYLKQVGIVPRGSVEARPFVQRLIAKDLKAAREEAGLTQAELAAKLEKSQTLVSQAEGGRERVGEKYVSAVLKACGLPKDWKPAKRSKKA
jgi:ribosome-binding protein aMBF1 (putative translation factor)